MCWKKKCRSQKLVQLLTSFILFAFMMLFFMLMKVTMTHLCCCKKLFKCCMMSFRGHRWSSCQSSYRLVLGWGQVGVGSGWGKTGVIGGRALLDSVTLVIHTVWLRVCMKRLQIGCIFKTSRICYEQQNLGYSSGVYVCGQGVTQLIYA